MTIDPALVDIALERVSGTQFELFCNEFFPSLLGVDYSPLGGMHDGGADAFGGDVVHERLGRAGNFYQASIRKDVKVKIRETIARLREFKREPRHLTYLTSVTVPHIDILEDDLGQDQGVTVRIRDGAYIRAHINDSAATVDAFRRNLASLTAFLSSPGSAPLLATSKHVKNSSVFVFLRQEVDKLDGNLTLIDAITDGLCLWALEGTDPDLGRLLSDQEILAKIADAVPSANSIVSKRVRARLEALSAKNYPGGRKVRWHKQQDSFALPFETRRQLEIDNQDDEALRINVLRGLETRVREVAPQLDEGLVSVAAAVTLRALQLSFEQQGLEFAHYVSSDDDVDYPYMADAVRQSLSDNEVSGQQSTDIANASLVVSRQCVYQATEDERRFLGRLARTYALLFTLSNEPRLVEYFQSMASQFYLYVGSDMLIRAMSERYLDAPNQMFRNVLLMAGRSGAKLILTEPVLEEVLGHLRASDYEFKNHIADVEHALSPELVREVPKILIRAYLYNRSRPQAPKSWPAFVQQFCTYGTLHRTRAERDLQIYLQSSFQMEFRSREDLLGLVNVADVEQIRDRLIPLKANEELAANDALLACSVYGHRNRTREVSTTSEFGFRTWWLTNESSILRHTRELRQANRGSRYMMRPDFLLNFFTFAPSAIHVRETFANVFPSALGLELSRRMDEEAFHKIMADMREAESYEEGRRVALMADCADRLKGDFERRYLVETKA